MATINELLDRMIKDNKWWVPGWKYYPNPPTLNRGTTQSEANEFIETFGYGQIWNDPVKLPGKETSECQWVLRVEDNLEPFLVLLYEKLKTNDPHNRVDYVIWTIQALECFNEGGEYGSTKPKTAQTSRKGMGLQWPRRLRNR